MIHIIKNNKWVIASSLVCILFGILTFFTFINQSFIKLTDINLQILLFVDFLFFILFFTLIIKKTYKIFKERSEGKIGSQTSLRYITFFSTITLVPSVIIAVFSLVLFNVGLQKYFDQKIKTAVNNSSEVARNYLEQSKASIESDISLILIDVNSKYRMFYDNPKRFLNVLTSQRMLRRLDELYILDSAGNLIMSTITTSSTDYTPPPDDSFSEAFNGKPVKIGAVDLVLYRNDVLQETHEEETNKEWELISFHAIPEGIKELPMGAITMMRNQLCLRGGTKGHYSSKQWAESVYFWQQYALLK